MTDAHDHTTLLGLPDAVDAALEPGERGLLLALLDPAREAASIANSLLADAAADRPPA